MKGVSINEFIAFKELVIKNKLEFKLKNRLKVSLLLWKVRLKRLFALKNPLLPIHSKWIRQSVNKIDFDDELSRLKSEYLFFETSENI